MEIINLPLLLISGSFAVYLMFKSNDQKEIIETLKPQKDSANIVISHKTTQINCLNSELSYLKDSLETLGRKLAEETTRFNIATIANTEQGQRLKFQKEINQNLKEKNQELERELESLFAKLDEIELNNSKAQIPHIILAKMMQAKEDTEQVDLSMLTNFDIVNEVLIDPIMNMIQNNMSTPRVKLDNIELIMETAIDTLKKG